MIGEKGTFVTKLKNLFTWRGRMGRVRYFFTVIVSAFVGFLLVAPALIKILNQHTTTNHSVAAGAEVTFEPPVALLLWVLAVMLVFSYIYVVSLIKRLHDINCSGWWSLLFLALNTVGMMGGWLSFLSALFLMLWPGSKGDNRFGTSRRTLKTKLA